MANAPNGGGDGDADPPASRMLMLQGFFMCVSFLPLVGLHGIGALVLNQAPYHLMGWSHANVGAAGCIAHWLITVELCEKPGWLEEVGLTTTHCHP